MLVGSADVDVLAQDAAVIHAFNKDAVVFDDLVCFQMTAEMHNQAREPVLPPALHPTVPPALSIQVWQIGRSPFGAFNMALARVSCRSGVRARGFTTQVLTSTDEATEGMRTTFGSPARQGDIDFRHSYHGVDITVRTGNSGILKISALDPEPMDLNDVQYTGTLNLANTPNGLRLVQLEAHHDATRVERLQAKLRHFDAAAWGNPLLDPYRVVSASIATETVTFPAIRFVCKVDETAFTGTEPVS